MLSFGAGWGARYAYLGCAVDGLLESDPPPRHCASEATLFVGALAAQVSSWVLYIVAAVVHGRTRAAVQAERQLEPSAWVAPDGQGGGVGLTLSF